MLNRIGIGTEEHTLTHQEWDGDWRHKDKDGNLRFRFGISFLRPPSHLPCRGIRTKAIETLGLRPYVLSTDARSHRPSRSFASTSAQTANEGSFLLGDSQRATLSNRRCLYASLAEVDEVRYRRTVVASAI